MTTAAEILTLAAGVGVGDREKEHGDKATNWANIAALWSAYLAIRRDPAAPLDGCDVGYMMNLLKIARTQGGAFSLDDHIDGAGYMAGAGELGEPPPPRGFLRWADLPG
jgi:hypothetical protein